MNTEIARRTNIEQEAVWNYASNITDENERRKNEISAELAKFFQQTSEEIRTFNWRKFKSDDLKRQFKALSKLGYAALPEDEYAEYLETMSKMEANYAKVKVCDYKNPAKCDLSLEPEIEDIFVKSRDPEELKYYWREFYDKAGTAARGYFEKYIVFNTKAAKLNSEIND